MKLRKTLAAILTGAMLFGLAACGSPSTPSPAPSGSGSGSTPPATSTTPAPSGGDSTEITLWTYPVGKWADEATVKSLTDGFTAETGIKVTVEYLAYADGDDKVNAAITAKQTPDLVLEGPQRLVTNWGVGGHMVDLSDMFDDTDKAEIDPYALNACIAPTGEIYEYPLVMTAHCMAVNLDAFKEAGADQYLDLENHTWTTENFFKAVEALNSHFGQTVGAVYCVGQGGDQGTRALVNNLYGGTFVNSDHTGYTWDDEANIQALKALYDAAGIDYDASIAGGDEIALFYQGVLKMAFCWNIQQQLNPNQANTGAGLTMNGEEIAFMSFPTSDGKSQLCGGVWGFGIFDNGDQARIDASKQFIKYMCDSEKTADAVRTASFFAVRDTAEGTDLTHIWDDEPLMAEYTKLLPMLGEYYEDVPGWAQARTSWWNMLQKIGAGEDIASTVSTYMTEANTAAAG
ncbi:MAG: extracellular solute-binding protein [Oscillospiraceae bacterium]|jgi:multiple sugar transport system substrate-binding protein|nr:extracellular solute-binding protein [Oscillospiraceae bacterium]MCI9580271.1 extracellular solute-binding protein [Oscillospiraceae bacterium]